MVMVAGRDTKVLANVQLFVKYPRYESSVGKAGLGNVMTDDIGDSRVRPSQVARKLLTSVYTGSIAILLAGTTVTWVAFLGWLVMRLH
jgi:hypothetical protein